MHQARAPFLITFLLSISVIFIGPIDGQAQRRRPNKANQNQRDAVIRPSITLRSESVHSRQTSGNEGNSKSSQAIVLRSQGRSHVPAVPFRRLHSPRFGRPPEKGGQGDKDDEKGTDAPVRTVSSGLRPVRTGNLVQRPGNQGRNNPKQNSIRSSNARTRTRSSIDSKPNTRSRKGDVRRPSANSGRTPVSRLAKPRRKPVRRPPNRIIEGPPRNNPIRTGISGRSRIPDKNFRRPPVGFGPGNVPEKDLPPLGRRKKGKPASGRIRLNTPRPPVRRPNSRAPSNEGSFKPLPRKNNRSKPGSKQQERKPIPRRLQPNPPSDDVLKPTSKPINVQPRVVPNAALGIPILPILSIPPPTTASPVEAQAQPRPPTLPEEEAESPKQPEEGLPLQRPAPRPESISTGRLVPTIPESRPLVRTRTPNRPSSSSQRVSNRIPNRVVGSRAGTASGRLPLRLPGGSSIPRSNRVPLRVRVPFSAAGTLGAQGRVSPIFSGRATGGRRLPIRVPAGEPPVVPRQPTVVQTGQPLVRPPPRVRSRVPQVPKIPRRVPSSRSRVPASPLRTGVPQQTISSPGSNRGPGGGGISLGQPIGQLPGSQPIRVPQDPGSFVVPIPSATVGNTLIPPGLISTTPTPRTFVFTTARRSAPGPPGIKPAHAYDDPLERAAVRRYLAKRRQEFLNKKHQKLNKGPVGPPILARDEVGKQLREQRGLRPRNRPRS